MTSLGGISVTKPPFGGIPSTRLVTTICPAAPTGKPPAMPRIVGRFLADWKSCHQESRFAWKKRFIFFTAIVQHPSQMCVYIKPSRNQKRLGLVSYSSCLVLIPRIILDGFFITPNGDGHSWRRGPEVAETQRNAWLENYLHWKNARETPHAPKKSYENQIKSWWEKPWGKGRIPKKVEHNLSHFHTLEGVALGTPLLPQPREIHHLVASSEVWIFQPTVGKVVKRFLGSSK